MNLRRGLAEDRRQLRPDLHVGAGGVTGHAAALARPRHGALLEIAVRFLQRKLFGHRLVSAGGGHRDFLRLILRRGGEQCRCDKKDQNFFHANISWATWPKTSVRRKSRPAWR